MLDITYLWMAFRSLFTQPTYGQTLEQYIVSNNPQNEMDIERLTYQYSQRQYGGISSWK